jgi:hypothetical protein
MSQIFIKEVFYLIIRFNYSNIIEHLNFIEKDDKQRYNILSISYQLVSFNSYAALKTTDTVF